MKVKCINNHGNSNFTVGKEYELRENPDKSKTSFGKYIVTCDFIHIFVNKYKRNKDILTIAFSEFEIAI
jgi:hypothetical protein